MKKLLTFGAGLVVICLFQNLIWAGEPVPGAEILIEQEPNDVPIQCVSDNDGVITFSFPKGIVTPKSGTLKLTITPPKSRKLSAPNKKEQDMTQQIILLKFQITKSKERDQTQTYNTSVSNMEEYKIMTTSSSDSPLFKLYLSWSAPDRVKSNRGGFAVSGRNTN